jgi:hypothetical protein
MPLAHVVAAHARVRAGTFIQEMTSQGGNRYSRSKETATLQAGALG